MQELYKPTDQITVYSKGDDNSDEIPDGANLDYESIRREDGIISQAALQAFAGRNNSGVLQRSMTAPTDDKDYRQVLITANWPSMRKGHEWVLAKYEWCRYGLSIAPLVDDLIAMKAGEHGSFILSIFEALTHTSFTTNYTNRNPVKRLRNWFNRDRGNNGINGDYNQTM